MTEKNRDVTLPYYDKDGTRRAGDISLKLPWRVDPELVSHIQRCNLCGKSVFVQKGVEPGRLIECGGHDGWLPASHRGRQGSVSCWQDPEGDTHLFVKDPSRPLMIRPKRLRDNEYQEGRLNRLEHEVSEVKEAGLKELHYRHIRHLKIKMGLPVEPYLPGPGNDTEHTLPGVYKVENE